MAITGALFKGYERTGSTYRVRVELTQSGGAPPYERWITVTGTTLQEVTNDARRQLAALVAADTSQDVLAGIDINTSIPITPPPSTPQSADQTWVANVRLLTRVKAAQSAGLSHATLTTDITALTNSVNAGYTSARGAML